MHRHRRRAYTLVGLLVALACLAILFAIGLTALNKAGTGGGSTTKSSVNSFTDQMALASLYQSMSVAALDNDGRFIVPSEVAGSDDPALNTTANLYSAMVAQEYIMPAQLVSANEYSPYVEADDDYDFFSYQPALGSYWDPDFVADLEVRSNVSYAHMPLYGERLRRYWGAGFDPNEPLIGNRGPEDGKEDPDSHTYGRYARWGGHVVFGDGSIRYLQGFVPPKVSYVRDGTIWPDNIFSVDDGLDGTDAILAFTKAMTEDGPQLQFD